MAAERVVVDGVSYIRERVQESDGGPWIRFDTQMYCTICGLKDFAQNMCRRLIQVTFGNDTRYVITGHASCIATFPKHRFRDQI